MGERGEGGCRARASAVVWGSTTPSLSLLFVFFSLAIKKIIKKQNKTKTDSIHLYGDVYATPGLPLATKQLLMVAFLGEAGMPDQLFGHALCALREGATASGLLAALDAGFQAARVRASPARAAVYEAGLAALESAWAKARQEWEGDE